MKKWGWNISKIRELKGVKQAALAQELGFSQQSISNLEKMDFIDD